MKALFLVSFFTFAGTLASMAQATATFTASATIIRPIGISTIANMNFANLEAGNGGVVVLTPQNTRIGTGDVALANGAKVQAATFEVTGQTGYTYSLTLPQDEYILTNGNENMVIKNFTSSLNNKGSLVNNTQTIRVGATLEVKPNQTPGIYTSTGGFDITVNYN